jgi:Ribbon-helix-helix protein, copG family
MRNTLLTFRLPEEMAEWLARKSRDTGIPVGQLIREQLEKARAQQNEPVFMRHAGKIHGPRDLSSRKGFSK